ncbi:Mannose-1-phosphate guanylyltransferase rfbM [Chromobacterium violaceum]|uniref:Mannose-1-phosphate guanylyltransferase rfbM n=1 Tax=Chromobacterium violaceum TaxID=536 RepID=A0A3S4HKD2_CHRVL|nr:Mannose-1-phosphate guanylyltransferase rfbM [Chromobacterium violaceum]
MQRVNERQLALELLLEPAGRNTAPAIAAAALDMLERQEGSEAILLVLPADHLVTDEEAFAAAVQEAWELAEAGRIVAFGLKPSRPETGFGYIEQGSRSPERALRWRVSSKSRTPPPRKPIWTTGATGGTAGCCAFPPWSCAMRWRG